MSDQEERLKRFLEENKIDAEHLVFEKSCHSVKEAAEAANADEGDFIKSICMISGGRLIVAIVKGADRASTSRVAKALNIERPRIATAQEIKEKTGYAAGGVPPFGFKAEFLMDEKVMEKGKVYGGGGSDRSLIKISPREIQRMNNAEVKRARK